MSTENSRFPAGELRASDADRDLAIAELSEHFQTGRLTQDEFDERSARALQARTGRELSELFTDLPGGGQSHGGADPAGRGGPAGASGSPDSSPAPGQPWPGPSWPGQAWRGPSRLDRSPRRRRSGAAAIAVIAAIAVASLLGSVGHVAVGHGGFGWLIPVFIVALVVRRIARRR